MKLYYNGGYKLFYIYVKKCATSRYYHKVNCGPGVLMMCQCSFISCKNVFLRYENSSKPRKYCERREKRGITQPSLPNELQS